MRIGVRDNMGWSKIFGLSVLLVLLSSAMVKAASSDDDTDTKVKKKKSESDERENARPESGNGPEQSERVQ